jgi:hypothetical protein
LLSNIFRFIKIRFLTPEGRGLPGVSEHDTIGYRIEALRVYLEQQLNEQIFINSYKLLQVNFIFLIPFRMNLRLKKKQAKHLKNY